MQNIYGRIGEIMKKIFAVLLAALMLVAIAVPVLAAEGEIPSAVGTKGANVTVNIKLTNNPGIAGATIKVTYDTAVLEPVADNCVTTGETDLEVISVNKDVAGEISIIVLNMEGTTVSDNGTVASIAFKVKDDAALGNTTIGVEFLEAADEDMVDKTVVVSQGIVEIKDYTPGDLNNDGLVNNADVIYLMYHTIPMYKDSYPLT